MLDWVAVPFSRGSSQPRDGTQVSRWATREAHKTHKQYDKSLLVPVVLGPVLPGLSQNLCMSIRGGEAGTSCYPINLHISEIHHTRRWAKVTQLLSSWALRELPPLAPTLPEPSERSQKPTQPFRPVPKCSHDYLSLKSWIVNLHYVTTIWWHCPMWTVRWPFKHTYLEWRNYPELKDNRVGFIPLCRRAFF